MSRVPVMSRLPTWLPRGVDLDDREFEARHRVVLRVLALHLPGLVLAGVLLGERPAHALVEAAGPALLLALACWRALPTRARAAAASVGLLSCSAVLVHLAHGATEMHFHYFVAVALIALYQDWTTYLLAVVFVAVQHGVSGATGAEPGTPGSAWAYAAVHAGFICALAAVQVVFWNVDEQFRRREAALRSELYEGRSSVVARLEETARIRADLLGTVSHEFRTPLTGIRAAALTLLKRRHRLDAAGQERLLAAILDQQERLSRLLENMLTASSVTAPDPDAVTDVHGVAAEVGMLAGAEHPGEVQILVVPGTTARVERRALHQVLANLVDNAQVHGAPGSTVVVAAGRDEDGVWLTVSNEGPTLTAEVNDWIFEPFSRVDASATRAREGAGMGLYVVRRLVEVHGGELSLRSSDGWTTVEVRLAPADAGDPGGDGPTPGDVPGAPRPATARGARPAGVPVPAARTEPVVR